MHPEELNTMWVDGYKS